MPSALIDGIETYYQVSGSGPPIVMLSPGGFDAAAANWSTLGVYSRLHLVPQLSERFSCIAFDRREAGASGGRVERVSWSDYAVQAKGLLDHLGIPRAHLLGGCAGCSVALAFAVAYPQSTARMALFWPAGGARYRMRQHARFARHLALVEEGGLDAVVDAATAGSATFGQDPRLGPWAGIIRRDQAFAAAYRRFDPGAYAALVAGLARTLFDRDSVCGAEPEDLMCLAVPTLVIPGHDDSHATSAARYLEECLPASEYWDVPVEAQTERNVARRMVDFFLGG